MALPPDAPKNWHDFVAEADRIDAYLSKPFAEWTEEERKEFNRYERWARIDLERAHERPREYRRTWDDC